LIQTPSADKPSYSSSLGFKAICGLLLALSTLGISSCHSAAYYYYKFPEYTYAGRPIPPSKLAERVMIGVTANGSSGSLQIVDALRDIRSNVEDTIPSFQISGYSSGYPGSILSFPAETRGYVYSNSDGSLTNINYSTEASSGSVGTFQSGSSAVAVPPTFTRYYGAEEAAGILELIDNTTGAGFGLNIPNVFKVVVNTGDTVALAMVRNSNVLYRIFKLNANQYPTQQAAILATGSADCEPSLLPVYCAVSVPGTYDRPNDVYFSLDGTTAYVLNCGPECGGNTASVTLLQQGPLNNNVIPSSPTQPNPQISNVHVPGGVTAAISDGTTLYLAGQQLQPDGLFAGVLSTMNQAFAVSNPSVAITGTYSISDGTHSKMLFADNNTLWIGSQFCASGERQKQFASGVTTQAANYGCLTRFILSGAILPTWSSGASFVVSQQVTDGTNTQVVLTAGTSGGNAPAWNTALDGTTQDGSVVWVNIGPTTRAEIVPSVTPNVSSSSALTVAYPNQNDNQYYYGSLTGICWVQNYNKVYTAYGGQVHIFSTVDGSEIDNQYVAVQGTALDVAYMDALTDGAN
jgi:Tfp pilus assembly major pilin PilA